MLGAGRRTVPRDDPCQSRPSPPAVPVSGPVCPYFGAIYDSRKVSRCCTQFPDYLRWYNFVRNTGKHGPGLRGCDGVPFVRSTRDWCQSLFRIFSWTHRCLAEEYSENSTESAREQFPNFLTDISFRRVLTRHPRLLTSLLARRSGMICVSIM